MRWLLPVAALALGWCLYIPIPNGIDNPAGFYVFSLVGYWKDKYFTAIERFSGESPLIALRRDFRALSALPTPAVNYTELEISGVAARLYWATTLPQRPPVIFYIHGGGFVAGGMAEYSVVLSRLALDTQAAILAIDYGLAPENPFPAALDDCMSAVTHLLEHGHEMGLDMSRLAVVGDSAGGNLAAVVTQLLAVSPQYAGRVKLQLLVAPVLQFVDMDLHMEHTLYTPRTKAASYLAYLLGSSVTETHILAYLEGRMLASADLNKLRASYLDSSNINTGEPILATHGPAAYAKLAAIALDPRVSPLLATDDTIAALPKTRIVAFQFDFLRDEALLYEKRLSGLGVDVSLDYVSGGIHCASHYHHLGFKTESGQRSYDDIVKWLTRYL